MPHQRLHDSCTFLKIEAMASEIRDPDDIHETKTIRWPASNRSLKKTKNNPLNETMQKSVQITSKNK
jgi:hypothetical protein